MMSSTRDKVVVITGGSSGLGEATARHLAGKGARVFLGARRVERLDAIVKDIERAGGQGRPCSDSVARAIQFAIEQPADVDINDIVLRPTVEEL